MKLVRSALAGISILAAYGLLLGVSAFAESDSAAEQKPALQPEPGSPGDTLTREDARMALLVYKLLDKDGKIKGATRKCRVNPIQTTHVRILLNSNYVL